jgi:hypothetical protein
VKNDNLDLVKFDLVTVSQNFRGEAKGGKPLPFTGIKCRAIKWQAEKGVQQKQKIFAWILSFCQLTLREGVNWSNYDWLNGNFLPRNIMAMG